MDDKTRFELDQMDLFELTRQLIDIPSLSGDEERVAHFLKDYLTSAGFTVELQKVAQGRPNVIATTTKPPRMAFSTHLDTVPPFTASSEDDENIYGRGACDAKGIIAAQIVAAERLREQGLHELGLLFTVDEELGSIGARAANEHALASQCEFLINGEPTDNRLASGSKGSLRVRLETAGESAHSAYPEHGESAVEKLLDVLASVRNCVWPTDEFFGDTTCNIGTVSGGTRPNVIPASAESQLQIRLVTHSSQVKELLEQAVGDRAEIDYMSVAEPVRLHTVDGFKQTVVRFTTDIPYLEKWGKPFLLGPGSILDAHTSHERVSKRELTEAVELYIRLANKLLTTD